LEHGYFYPEPDSQDAHHGLVSLLRIDNSGTMIHVNGKERFLSRLEEFKRTADGRCVVISSELFSEPVCGPVIGSLREMFDSVRIVLYLRRQDTLLESVHNQVLKQDAVRHQDILKAKLYPYDLNRSIARWRRLFGEENLIVRRFEESKLYKGDIFLDFLEAIDVKLDTEWLGLKTTQVNESLSMIEYMVLDRLAGTGVPNWSDAVESTREIVRERYRSHDCRMVGGYLTYDQRIAFLKMYQESNADILMKFFPDDDELFSSPTQHADAVNDPALLEDMGAAFVDVLRELAIRASAKAEASAAAAAVAAEAARAAVAAAAVAATEAAAASAAAATAATEATKALARAAKGAREAAGNAQAPEDKQAKAEDILPIASVEIVQAAANPSGPAKSAEPDKAAIKSPDLSRVDESAPLPASPSRPAEPAQAATSSPGPAESNELAQLAADPIK
jgi:hypothetical protein